ncbi:MAG: corrinoid protein [Dethiobacter sp.]|jgi:5-methyltetrahydrofolate--homocysteine methyltransferase|nr:corrinoid protein [Dethiobacter sp.]
MTIIQEIKDAVENGNLAQVTEGIKNALAQGVNANTILNEGLIAGMQEVGIKFKNNEVYVPEVLIASRAVRAGTELIIPFLVKADMKEKGTIVIGTVKGDLHDIGKNLVIMLLEGAGYKVIDLGIDVPADKFVQSIEKYNPQIVALSALLTTTMPEMKNVTEILNSRFSYIKVLIGGAPVTQDFADKIGAHGYAPDAGSAVDKADQLIALL